MILQMINHILWQIDISSLPAGEDRIKVKTQRMKSKDRYLGVLNMPDATEVSFFLQNCKKMIFNGQGRRGKAFEVEQEKEETADHLPQDHRQQDLLHHQPADEGKRAWDL